MGSSRPYPLRLCCPYMKIKKGFTFIEVIIVISIVLFALPALFAIIFVILQEQTKLYRLSQVKREGDFAMAQIVNTIRSSAKTLHDVSSTTRCDDSSLSSDDLNDSNSICATAGSTSTVGPEYFCFKDKYGSGNKFNYYVDSNGTISSASAKLVSAEPLVSNNMFISSFTVSCTRSASYSTPLVKVSFDICYNTGGVSPCSSARPEETATLHYQANIKLTSY